MGLSHCGGDGAKVAFCRGGRETSCCILAIEVAFDDESAAIHLDKRDCAVLQCVQDVSLSLVQLVRNSSCCAGRVVGRQETL